MSSIRLSAVLVAFAACTVASAGPILIDFENLSEGDTVSNQYSLLGVLVGGSPEIFTAGSLLNEIDFPPHSGMNVMVDVGGPITFTFTTPLLSVGAFFTYTTNLTLSTFTPTGVLLQTKGSSGSSNFGGPGSNEFISFASAAGNIGSLRISGDSLGSSFTLDDLTISAVPEPSSFILTLPILFIGAYLFRRREHTSQRVVATAICQSIPAGGLGRCFLNWVVGFSAVLFFFAPGACLRGAQQPLLPINSLIPNPPLVYIAAGTTTITLVANVAPVAAMIPGSVTLNQVTSTGALVRVIGPMYDDGPGGGHGDSIAGDNNFALQVPVSNAVAAQFYYRASVAYRGVIQRGQSPIASVFVAVPSTSTAPDPAQLITDSSNNTYPKNHVLFSVPPSTPSSTIDSIVASVNGTIIGSSSGANQYQLQLPAGANLDIVLTTLSLNPNVSGAGKNYMGTPQGSTDLSNLGPPNSAAYDKIQATAAFQALASAATPFSAVTIGIVDTGIYAGHPEFNNLKVALGQTPVSDQTDNSANGHGTSVAGIIGASNCAKSTVTGGSCSSAEMNGLLAGVPAATPSGSAIPYTVEVRTSTTLGLYAADLAAKLDDLASKGASVIHIGYSWPGLQIIDPTYSEYTCAFVAVANRYSNVLFVVPAGDSGVDAFTVFPANVAQLVSTPGAFCPGQVASNNVIAVGATDLSDNRALFSAGTCPSPSPTCASNFGANITLAAPGIGVYAPTVPTPANGNALYTNSFQGTSASVAMVAGAAALLKSVNTGCNIPSVISAMQFSGDTISTDHPIGGKRLNLSNLVKPNIAPVDVYFLIDSTGSVGSTVGPFANNAAQVITNLASGGCSLFQFGYGQFKDYLISPWGDPSDAYTYKRVVDVSSPQPVIGNPGHYVITDLLATLTGGGGNDEPEAQLAALAQTATGAGQTIPGYPVATIPSGQQASWRPLSKLKIVVIFTDANFHKPGDSNSTGSPIIPYPGPSFAAVETALQSAGNVKVIGMQAHEGGGANYLATATADLQTIASATGAVAPSGGVSGCTVSGLQIAAGQPIVCQLPSPSADPGGTQTTSIVTNAILALVNSLP